MPKKMPRGLLNVYRLFHGESDRAAVVLAGAYLDALLDELLRSWHEPDAHDYLESPNGFLSSYGAKYNLAHAMGAITPGNRDQLKLVGSIRNHYAHHVMTAEWSHPNVQKQLRKITSPVTGDSDRERFVRLVTILSMDLMHARLRAPERRKLNSLRAKNRAATLTRWRNHLHWLSKVRCKRRHS